VPRRGAVLGEPLGEEPRLVVVPHAPPAEDRLERAVAHRLAQDRVDPRHELGALGRRDDDVVADRHRLGLRVQARVTPHRALGEHVVEQHAVHAAEQQIAVGVHVVVVGDGSDAVLALGREEQVVGDGAAERGHGAPRAGRPGRGSARGRPPAP
jgi:hypothetical protein